MQFKALPLPGETAAESHFFYVPANMVRPLQVKPREIRNKTRPASINSIDDVTTSTPFVSLSKPKLELCCLTPRTHTHTLYNRYIQLTVHSIAVAVVHIQFRQRFHTE